MRSLRRASLIIRPSDPSDAGGVDLSLSLSFMAGLPHPCVPPTAFAVSNSARTPRGCPNEEPEAVASAQRIASSVSTLGQNRR